MSAQDFLKQRDNSGVPKYWIGTDGERFKMDLVDVVRAMNDYTAELRSEIDELTLSLQVANQGLDILYSENKALKDQIKELGNQL